MYICIWNYDVLSCSCDWSDVQPSLHFFSGDASATHRSQLFRQTSLHQCRFCWGYCMRDGVVWDVVNQPTAIPCGSVVRL